MPTEDTTGQGKLTVGKLYGGVLIYEIWKTTRFSNLEILAKMEEEMEEKEKLERGEIVAKPAPTPSEGEKTEKTEDTALTNVTQALPVEEELTEAKCDDRLKEIKNELNNSAQIPRDTSFDRYFLQLDLQWIRSSPWIFGLDNFYNSSQVFTDCFSDWRCPSGEWTWPTERSSDTTVACGTPGTAGITTPPLHRLQWPNSSRDTIRSSITLNRFLLLSTMVTIRLLKDGKFTIPMRTGECGVSNNTGSAITLDPNNNRYAKPLAIFVSIFW